MSQTAAAVFFSGLLFMLAFCRSALAEPVTVRWENPPPSANACLDRQRLRSEVRRALGRDLFVELEPDVLLRASTALNPPSLELQLSDTSGRTLGQRRLRAESCAELTSIAALVLSLMLDFDAAEMANKIRDAEAARAQLEDEEKKAGRAASKTAATESSPEPINESKAAESSPEPINEASVDENKPARFIRGANGVVQALVRSGVAPELTTGFGLAVGAELVGGWTLGAAGSFWPSRRFDALGGVLRVAQWQAALDGCLPPLAGHVSLTACAELRLAALSASSSGFDESTGKRGVAVLPGGLLRFSADYGAALLRLDLAANVALSRLRLTLAVDGEPSTLHQIPWISLGASLGVGLKGW